MSGERSSGLNNNKIKHFVIIVLGALLFSCAKTSPRLEAAIETHNDGLSAQAIFEKTFVAHGGEHLALLNDVNVAVDGEWYYLITKIQPEVTDDKYRQQSEERILTAPHTYAAMYTGEAGAKGVLRSPKSIEVAYDSVSIDDNVKQSASALTADAFYLFTLGPLALHKRVINWRRLADQSDKGKSYYRINGELTPGIGMSQSDFITLWIDKQSDLTYRLHITLDGFENTKGAHVDTTFLAYATQEHFVLPTHFFERVVGPIRIDAHEWWYTGMDINRGLTSNDVLINEWSEQALRPATPYDGRSGR